MRDAMARPTDARSVLWACLSVKTAERTLEGAGTADCLVHEGVCFLDRLRLVRGSNNVPTFVCPVLDSGTLDFTIAGLIGRVRVRVQCPDGHTMPQRYRFLNVWIPVEKTRAREGARRH